MSGVRIPLHIFRGTRIHVRFHHGNYLEIELNQSEETLALAATEVETHFHNMDLASVNTRAIVLTGYLLHALFAHDFVETAYPPALWTTEVGAFVLDKQRARLHALQTNCAVVDAVKKLAEARRLALWNPTLFGIAGYKTGPNPSSGFSSDDEKFGSSASEHWRVLELVYSGSAGRLEPFGPADYEERREEVEYNAYKLLTKFPGLVG